MTTPRTAFSGSRRYFDTSGRLRITALPKSKASQLQATSAQYPSSAGKSKLKRKARWKQYFPSYKIEELCVFWWSSFVLPWHQRLEWLETRDCSIDRLCEQSDPRHMQYELWIHVIHGTRLGKGGEMLPAISSERAEAKNKKMSVWDGKLPPYRVRTVEFDHWENDHRHLHFILYKSLS